MKQVYDLEFRWSEYNNDYELVQWGKKEDEEKPHCFVIAVFRKGHEGCNIEFVGDRPFRVKKDQTVWAMLKYGQEIVDAECRLDWSINNG